MQSSASYHLGILPGEIVVSARPILIRFRAQITPDSTRGIGIKGHRVAVELGDDAKTVSVDATGLAPGPHVLMVEEVVKRRGGERLESTFTSFHVVKTKAPIPPELAPMHAVRLRIGEFDVERLAMADGVEEPWVDAFKAIDRERGKPVQLAFDHRGKPVDLDRVLEDVARRRAKKYGRFHPTLFEAVEASEPEARLPVAVWLVDPEPPVVTKRERGATRRPKDTEEHFGRWQELGRRFVDSVANTGFEPERIDMTAPIVFGSVPASAVRRLVAAEGVAGVFLHEREGFVDLGNSIAIANSDDAHNAGFTGNGVNAAVYEDGPSDTTDLVFAGRFHTSPPASDHARLTSAIIRNSEASAPHGHAPDCNLFSANSMDLDAIRWAAQTEGCTVISQSFHRDSEQTSDSLSFDDIYKDNLALHWPFPTICHAAGNGTSTEFVNHKGFNTLAVGSHDDSAAAMASDSVFRNPKSSHGDRELPELAANGIVVTAVGETMSGTSFAAPATAGATAVVQSVNATLESWPEGCRAILMASAWRNPAGGTWRSDNIAGVDAADGAGAVDTNAAVQIARNRRSKNSAGTSKGWDVGTLRSPDLDSSGQTTYRYQVSVPRKIVNPHVKVALAWDSKISTFNFVGIEILLDSVLTVDLDLLVFDSGGRLVASSMSWNNSYEIAEFDATAGETYDIRIRRWSGTDDVWHGIAWTVTGLPFLIDIGSLHTAFQLGPR